MWCRRGYLMITIQKKILIKPAEGIDPDYFFSLFSLSQKERRTLLCLLRAWLASMWDVSLVLCNFVFYLYRGDTNDRPQSDLKL